jgi:hypothetical protein
MMTSDHLEKLRREYTDKYVAVDGSRPELARFRGYVGQVRTVNFSGRALVEFVDYHRNIGWYDIDVDYLKVVDKPVAKENQASRKPAAKKAAAGDKSLSPLELARAADHLRKNASTAAVRPSPPD